MMWMPAFFSAVGCGFGIGVNPAIKRPRLSVNRLQWGLLLDRVGQKLQLLSANIWAQRWTSVGKGDCRPLAWRWPAQLQWSLLLEPMSVPSDGPDSPGWLECRHKESQWRTGTCARFLVASFLTQRHTAFRKNVSVFVWIGGTRALLQNSVS